MKKLTLKDIAKAFNVSISTASKAINDSNEISKDLRKKIQNYAISNNYRSKKVAFNLSNKSTKTIAIIVPNILNYFFTQVFYGVQRVINERGYKMITCVSDESYEKEVATTQLFNSGGIDGLVVSLAKETQKKNKVNHFSNLIENNIPIVMFDRVSEQIPCDKVVVDDFEAAYKAAKHLIQTGCKNIIFLSTIYHSSVGKLRLDGYRKALEDYEIEYDEKLIVNVGKSDDVEILVTLYLNYKPIDAIIALDEMSAVEVLKIVQGRGYKVPEDISIIGFTNGMLSRHVTPTLTTVSQHGKFIGEKSANILLDRIEQKTKDEPPSLHTVKTSLIVRDSTKPLQ